MSDYISQTIRDRIRQEAGYRCGYCLSSQRYVMGHLEIEHIIPVARGGNHETENLWLSCRLCNSYKGIQISAIDPATGKEVQLFNPRNQKWSAHFYWSDDGTSIVGNTPCGRATIIALQLNNPIAVTVRRNWVSAGWHPPGE